MHKETSLIQCLTRYILMRSPGVSDNTRKYHRELVAQILHAMPSSAGKFPKQILPDEIAEFALKAGHYSGPRWNAMVAMLKRFVPAAKELKRRRILHARQPPPTQAEFTALLAACDRLPKSRAGLVVAFLARTGLRISAARRVKWSDVYADRIEYIAKGGRRCSVPIISSLRETLEQLRTISDGSGFVLPRQGIRSGLTKACKEVGLRTLSHHDFRHLFTTRCIESGVDLPTVARWRGDADGGAMLSKVYFHLLDDHSRQAALRVRI